MSDLKPFKEFKPTSWAIDNRVTIFILSIIVTLADRAGFDPRLAKFAAIVTSFALTYALRARVVLARVAGRLRSESAMAVGT